MGGIGRHFAVESSLAAGLLAGADDDVVAALEDIEEEWERPWVADTDKAWDALHRCLTDGSLTFDGGEYPLSHAILGGQQMLRDDDYIAVYVSADQVRDVAAALGPVDEGWLRQRFFGLDLGDYDGRGDEEDFRYTWENFVELRDFYRAAAAAGRAVLFTVDS